MLGHIRAHKNLDDETAQLAPLNPGRPTGENELCVWVGGCVCVCVRQRELRLHTCSCVRFSMMFSSGCESIFQTQAQWWFSFTEMLL